jgi:ATP-binding cassette subfamily F protein 3
LVAPNGAGKSTLLRLLVGDLKPDQGSVVIRKETSVGYYRQSHELPQGGDVMSAFLSGFGEILALRAELRAAEEGAASGEEAALARLVRATDRYHLAHGDDVERRITTLSQRLGFRDGDLARPVESLSGGERGRLLLGVILAREPTLLLLDEPTNHLDLDTIGWLESYLSSYKGAVLVVSHDRAFLDAVTNQTLELGQRSFRSYPLSYSAYAVAREVDLARERTLVERQADQIAKTEEYIRRNIAGQNAKQAQGRKKILERQERLDRPEDVWNTAEKVAFRFASAPRTGDIVLEATGLNAQRGGRALFGGVDLLVRRGERLGIVGPNGSGKSTLLKLLAGQADERFGDGGLIKRGTNLAAGYFDQHLGGLDEKKTLVEEIRHVRGDMNIDVTRQYLSRFRFYGDDTLRGIAGLSGGERTRLALAKMLLEPKNLLFLDEPTNHLDIPACEILEEALVSFEGTVVFVSHDRRFLERVATRIVSVRDGVVDRYPGTYVDFLAHRAREAEVAAENGRGRGSDEGAEKKAGKAAYEADRLAARELERKKRRFKELEALVAEGEAALAKLRDELRAADPDSSWEALAERAEQEQALATNVEALLEEWMSLGEAIANQAPSTSTRSPAR